MPPSLRPGLFTAPAGPATPRPAVYSNPPEVGIVGRPLRWSNPSPSSIRLENPPPPRPDLSETLPALLGSDWVYVGVACRPEHVAEAVAKLTSLLERMLKGMVPRISVDVRVSSRAPPGEYSTPSGMAVSYWPRGADRFGADPTVLAWLSEQVRRELEGA